MKEYVYLKMTQEYVGMSWSLKYCRTSKLSRRKSKQRNDREEKRTKKKSGGDETANLTKEEGNWDCISGGRNKIKYINYFTKSEWTQETETVRWAEKLDSKCVWFQDTL